jgi:hypothetical protein
MPQPQAISKAIAAMKVIEPLMWGLARPDEITLARLRRDIHEGISVDAFHGYIALGMLAVVEWDEAGVDANFKKAIQLSNSQTAHLNYAVALQVMGKYHRSGARSKAGKRCSAD